MFVFLGHLNHLLIHENSYGTEPAVGKAIKKSGVPRKELFVTTKLWNNSHHPDDFEAAIDASLKDLGLDYLDLYLMHWPSPFARGSDAFPKDSDGKVKTGNTDFVEVRFANLRRFLTLTLYQTYKAMEKVLKSGKTKAIGVSNFSRAELERLLKETSVVPAVHQLELHPWLQQRGFAEFHKSKGIHITQYSPFGNQNEFYDGGKQMGKLIEDPTLVEIGKKYGKSGAQVALGESFSTFMSIEGDAKTCIAWGVAHGHSVIPKSKTPARIRANLEGDFKLEPEDLQKVDSLDKQLRFNDPSKRFAWDLFADLDGKKK